MIEVFVYVPPKHAMHEKFESVELLLEFIRMGMEAFLVKAHTTPSAIAVLVFHIQAEDFSAGVMLVQRQIIIDLKTFSDETEKSDELLSKIEEMYWEIIRDINNRVNRDIINNRFSKDLSDEYPGVM